MEQELGFYKLDTKFDEFWKFSGYEPQVFANKLFLSSILFSCKRNVLEKVNMYFLLQYHHLPWILTSTFIFVQDGDDQYIDEDQSPYIGKARFKPNSMANEGILPSKAQIVNFIRWVKRKDDKADEINKTIMHDLEEALNVDFKEMQIAIDQG